MRFPPVNPRLWCTLAAVALAAAGCGRPAPAAAGPEAAPANLDVDAALARAAVNQFLALEARGLPAADTLLAPGADFIMTGVRVTTRPRLAGLNGPGEAAIEESGTGFAGSLAWVVVSYRFTGRSEALNERARATFVLEKQRAGWRIRHAHSSMVERW